MCLHLIGCSSKCSLLIGPLVHFLLALSKYPTFPQACTGSFLRDKKQNIGNDRGRKHTRALPLILPKHIEAVGCQRPWRLASLGRCISLMLHYLRQSATTPVALYYARPLHFTRTTLLWTVWDNARDCPLSTPVASPVIAYLVGRTLQRPWLIITRPLAQPTLANLSGRRLQRPCLNPYSGVDLPILDSHIGRLLQRRGILSTRPLESTVSYFLILGCYNNPLQPTLLCR